MNGIVFAEGTGSYEDQSFLVNWDLYDYLFIFSIKAGELCFEECDHFEADDFGFDEYYNIDDLPHEACKLLKEFYAEPDLISMVNAAIDEAVRHEIEGYQAHIDNWLEAAENAKLKAVQPRLQDRVDSQRQSDDTSA